MYLSKKDVHVFPKTSKRFRKNMYVFFQRLSIGIFLLHPALANIVRRRVPLGGLGHNTIARSRVGEADGPERSLRKE